MDGRAELTRVAFHITGKPLAKRQRIARIGFYFGALFVEFARRDHVTVRAGGQQLPVKTEPEAACLVNNRGGGARDKR